MYKKNNPFYFTTFSAKKEKTKNNSAKKNKNTMFSPTPGRWPGEKKQSSTV
jgi:hypothetical protein